MNDAPRLKSTIGMWIVFFLFLAILLSISIAGINSFISINSNDSLATNVYTIGDDVFSMKVPETWTMDSSSDTSSGISFLSANGYESLYFSPSKLSFEQESAIYLIEINEMFNQQLSFTSSSIADKKIKATQIMLNNTYYLCGVKESGNTVIRFMYTASIMIQDPSPIDEIIESINYRQKIK